jgi:hypothetical protein
LDFKATTSAPKVIFLLGCDNNITPEDIPKDSFVVYIVRINLFRDHMETKELNTLMSSFQLQPIPNDLAHMVSNESYS